MKPLWSWSDDVDVRKMNWVLIKREIFRLNHLRLFLLRCVSEQIPSFSPVSPYGSYKSNPFLRNPLLSFACWMNDDDESEPVSRTLKWSVCEVDWRTFELKRDKNIIPFHFDYRFVFERWCACDELEYSSTSHATERESVGRMLKAIIFINMKVINWNILSSLLLCAREI